MSESAREPSEEKRQLREQLGLVQQSLLWKVEGLGDEELRRPMTKTGTNLVGIVKHLTGITYGYLCSAFGRDREPLAWESDEELLYGLDMWATPDESPQELIATYRRACDAAMQTIDELALDTLGKHHSGSTVSLRWMILTVLLDTTRHVGHADVIREAIDGRVGSGPGDPMVADDEEVLRRYRDRITGRLDRESWLAFQRSRPDYDPSAWDDYRSRVIELWHMPGR